MTKLVFLVMLDSTHEERQKLACILEEASIDQDYTFIISDKQLESIEKEELQRVLG